MSVETIEREQTMPDKSFVLRYPDFRRGMKLPVLLLLRRILVAGCLLGWVRPGQTQAFRIDSTVPAEGATGVAQTATIQFNLNQPVSLENNWSAVLRFEPGAGITPGLLTIGDLATGETDVITYDVTHALDTDTFWFVFGLRSETDEAIEPFLLRYTTAASWGVHTVSGVVTDDPSVGGMAGKGRMAPVLWRRPRAGVPLHIPGQTNYLETKTWWPGRIRPVRTGQIPKQAGGTTLVFLADRNLLVDDDWGMRAATLTAEASGSYTIPYVREGVYWPFALKDLDDQGEPFEAIGIYDPDADGQPDSLVVGGANVQDIHLTVFNFVPTTAQATLAPAREVAARFAPDQQLKAISASPVGLDGYNLEWVYDFYAPGSNRLTTVFLTGGLLAAVDTSEAPTLVAEMKPIPDAFVDSPPAVDTALLNGGQEFLTQYSTAPITPTLVAGNQFWKALPGPEALAWEVRYGALTDTSFQELSLFVDLGTGVYLGRVGTASEPAPPAAGLSLEQYPNPFSETTTFRLSLAAPTFVRLVVYDVLGRTITTVAAGHLPAGEHQLPWNAAGLPAGLYLCRLEAGHFVQHHTAILQR
jgi:hypothetical protein